MDRDPTNSPEYRAIRQNRQALEEQLSSCFKQVAALLCQKEILTDGRCTEISKPGNGPKMLVGDVLLGVKVTPVESFAEFVDALKRSGNKPFRTFVSDSIEKQRKTFYRELFRVETGPGPSSQTQYGVFISYSRDPDTKLLVDTIESRLTREGLKVFVDTRNIHPGDVWPAEIVNAIRSCKAFVALLTKKYVGSLYCNGELYEAEALGKRIFPVECESGWGQEPAGKLIEEVVKQIQHISLGSEVSREEDLTRLARSIVAVVSPVATPTSLPVATPTSSPETNAALPQREAAQLTEHTDGGSPGTGSSVDDRIKRLKEKMNVSDTALHREIVQTDLPYIADCVSSTELYTKALELSGGESTDVKKTESVSGVRIAMQECLSKWKSHTPFGATFMALLRVMVSLNNMEDARKLLEYVKRTVRAQPAVQTEQTREQETMQSPDSDSEGEDCLPDSFLLKHRTAIEDHRERLCRDMDPLKVIVQLRKHGVFTLYDQQKILGKPADYDRSGDIIDQLYHCGPQAFHEFVRALKSIDQKHTVLACTLQPVRHRVLWFASSPALAAAVVHSLEKHDGVKFPEFPDTLPSVGRYVVRRAGIFQRMVVVDNPGDEDDGSDRYECVEDAEVCLVFPVEGRRDLVKEAMGAAFDECPHPCVAVMCGVCDGVRGVVSEGDVIIVDTASTPTSNLHLDSAHIHTAKQTIDKLLTPPHPHWTRDLSSTHTLRTRGPLLGTIATPPSALEEGLPKLECADDQSRLACDEDTYEFYQLCRTKLARGIPYYSCKGVAGDTLSGAVLSSCVAMEMCRVAVERARTS